MRARRLTTAFFSLCLCLSGCGKSSEDDAGSDAGNGGTGTGGPGGSGSGEAGANQGIDHGYMPVAPCTPAATCGEGIDCVELVAGGVARCVFMGGRSTATCSGDDRDECCGSAECEEGDCYSVATYPSGRCGLGGVDVYNRCLEDECSDDSQCAGGFCALGPRRTCMVGACKTDADCTESPGGVCRALDLGCCSGSAPAATDRTLATACVYPGDGCTYDDDCPSGAFCTIAAGRAACRRECTPNTLEPQ